MHEENLWEIKFEHLKHLHKRRAEAIALLLELKHDDVLLDVGCGEGYVTSFFLNQAGFTVGLDVSLRHLKIAKTKLPASSTDFCRGDALNLPFRSACFDKIAVLEVLEHLRRPRICVREADRCAKKNALIVISVPWREKIRHEYNEKLGSHVPKWGHLHSFSERDIVSFLPSPYALIVKKHLPNTDIHKITWLPLIRHLPIRIWLKLNDKLGRIEKGYWVIFKFKKL